MFKQLCIGMLAAAPAMALGQGILPIVTMVSENSAATEITINGTGFGSAKPSVTLAGTNLTIVSFSGSTITADLPTGTAPGSYLITIENNSTHLPGVFAATLGAQGLQGVAGPTGLQGPPGSQGVPGLQGMQGAAGLNGTAGAAGATGPTGAAGAAGGQLWSASFTMPNELNTLNLTNWNQIQSPGSPRPTYAPMSTVASPSGSTNAIALAPDLTANTAKAFLLIPATCTASSLNAYIIGAQTTAYGATISLGTADPVNGVTPSAVAPQVSPTTTALSCQITSGQAGTNVSSQQCSSSSSSAALLAGGQLVTVIVTPADTTDALVGLQVMTSFNCDTTNTTGVPAGWNQIKNQPPPGPGSLPQLP